MKWKLVLVAALMLGGCTTTPVTNRTQFMMISPDQEMTLGATEAKKVVETSKISTDKKLQEMELVKEKELFELQATYDGMTKLYNRQKTEDILKIEIDRSRRYGIELSVLMLDIDDFKKINDTYGHPTGDTVLREISRLIRKCIRKTDYAGRWGGEEFIVIAPHTDLKGASVFAESIREIVEATDFAGGKGYV